MFIDVQHLVTGQRMNYDRHTKKRSSLPGKPPSRPDQPRRGSVAGPIVQAERVRDLQVPDPKGAFGHQSFILPKRSAEQGGDYTTPAHRRLQPEKPKAGAATSAGWWSDDETAGRYSGGWSATDRSSDDEDDYYRSRRGQYRRRRHRSRSRGRSRSRSRSRRSRWEEQRLAQLRKENEALLAEHRELSERLAVARRHVAQMFACVGPV